MLSSLKLVPAAPEDSGAVSAPRGAGAQPPSPIPGHSMPILAPSLLLPAGRNGEGNRCDGLCIFGGHANTSALGNQIGMRI